MLFKTFLEDSHSWQIPLTKSVRGRTLPDREYSGSFIFNSSAYIQHTLIGPLMCPNIKHLLWALVYKDVQNMYMSKSSHSNREAKYIIRVQRINPVIEGSEKSITGQ